MRSRHRFVTPFNSVKPSSKLVAVCTLVVGLVVPLLIHMPYSSSATVQSRIRANENLSLITKAMDISYYWEKIDVRGAKTLFLPTDDAMVKEGSDFLLQSVLMTPENRERLVSLVSAHMTVAEINITDLDSDALLPALSGDCLLITKTGDGARVGPGAEILTSEVVEGIHIVTVNKLLIPDFEMSDDCKALQLRAEVR